MAAVGFALALAALALGTVPMIGVVALIPASIGLVFGVIGLVQSRRTHQGKWLAIPAIVVSVAAAFWVPVASTLIPWFVESLTHASLAMAPSTTTASTSNSAPPASRRIMPPAEPTQYSPPAMRRHTTDAVTPTHTPPPGARDALEPQHELDRRIAEFAERARKESMETWPDDVASLRKAIDEVGDQGVTNRLHRALDDAVMVVVESEAAVALQRATAAQPAEGLRILDAFMQRAQAGATVAYTTPLTPSMAAVTDLRRSLAMQQDPAQRYVPRGIMGGARGLRVTLHDALTGENHVVAEGAALADGFIVTSIHEDAREVRLTRGGKEYRLHW